MALGRIKRTPGKLRKAHHGLAARQLNVKVYVQRAHRKTQYRGAVATGGYEALACYRSKSSTVYRGDNCSAFTHGRTPQSAIAKALKSLSTKTATRSRKRR